MQAYTIRAHDSYRAIDCDLEQVRREVLQPIPRQNAVVGIRRKIEVLRHELIREQGVALIPEAISNVRRTFVSMLRTKSSDANWCPKLVMKLMFS